MKIVKIFLIMTVARNVMSRRHILSSSSGESIENLIYFQDDRKSTSPPTTVAPVRLRAEAPKPTCPFPKMCCAMSCNNAPCVSEQLNMFGNQMHPNIEPGRMQQSRPYGSNPAIQRARKKKLKPSVGPMQGVSGRRDFGFTKENIKSLIAKDDDIRKILKDLVRVTMQKVDLQEMINTRRKMMASTTVTPIPEESEYMEDDI